MDICNLRHPHIFRVSREVSFCSHFSGRDSSSSKPPRRRDFNLERVEKGEEEGGVVWLPGATSAIMDLIGHFWIRKLERLGNEGNNGRFQFPLFPQSPENPVKSGYLETSEIMEFSHDLLLQGRSSDSNQDRRRIERQRGYSRPKIKKCRASEDALRMKEFQ